MSVSVIEATEPGLFVRGDHGGSIGAAFADLDLLRPATQQGPTELDAEPLSIETIGEFTANPLWQAVDAVTCGDVISVDVQDAGSHGYPGLENAARTIADGLTPSP